MTTQTVIYLLPCAAMPRGCASALAIDGPPGIELLALDLEVPEDKRVHGLITAAGWRLDHGKWVCPNHPFTTPAGPVTALYWPTVPTPEQAEAAKQAVLETAVALYDEQQPAPGRVPTVIVGQDFAPEHRYVLRAYRQAHGQPTVTAGMPTAVEVNGAVTWWNQRQAATVEVATGEPDAALYFTCQNRHPLAVRTTTILENGVRRAVHHEVVCPACEADGITEVQLPDLDDGGEDD